MSSSNRIKNLIGKLQKTGFTSIFFSNILAKTVVFFGGIILVRILSPEDYGKYAYILNCFGILCLLNDFGCSTAINQFCSENHNKVKKFNDYFVYGFSRSVLFSAITGVLVFVSPYFYPYTSREVATMTQWLCLLPLITSVNGVLLNHLRVRLLNNKFAIINVFSSFVHYLIIIPVAYLWSLGGAVLSAYAIQLSVLIFSVIVSKKELSYTWKGLSLSKKERCDFLKYSLANQFNNTAAASIALIDIFVIGLFVAQFSLVSEYKVGATIPTALVFVPQSISTYLFPHLVRHIGDKGWLGKFYKKLVLYNTFINGGIVVVGLIFSSWLIPAIFGAQYTSAVPYFRVLLIAYFFSASYKLPTATFLLSQRKTMINIVLTLVAGAINIVLNVLFILQFGTIGVAYSTLAVSIIMAIISLLYFTRYLKKTIGDAP